jgi:hypothetical protein
MSVAAERSTDAIGILPQCGGENCPKSHSNRATFRSEKKLEPLIGIHFLNWAGCWIPIGGIVGLLGARRLDPVLPARGQALIATDNAIFRLVTQSKCVPY